MSAKKRNKKSRKKQAPPTLREKIQAYFASKNPILKFLLGFVGSMLLFYLFYYSGLYRNYLEYPFLNAQVRLSNLLLQLFGQGTIADGTIISSSEFSVNLKNGCDGLEAMAILCSGIIIFPIEWSYKWKGILWGILILFVANLLRIAGLYLAGRYFSAEVFDILHIQGGFIVFTLLSVLLWFLWMNWAINKKQKTAVV